MAELATFRDMLGSVCHGMGGNGRLPDEQQQGNGDGQPGMSQR